MTRALGVLTVAAVAGCASIGDAFDDPVHDLELAATSERQWTGIAVTGDHRVFVNYPRWSDDVPVSVAELVDGESVPFPDARWNGWEPGDDPATHFVCVQALFVDGRGRLWILDPANPGFEGAVPGGPKLMAFDPGTGALVRSIPFGPDVAPADSYLNDLRVDLVHDVIYMTDSGAGALIVVDLVTGDARRVLDDHPSTESEGVTLTIGGSPWIRPDGSSPDVHADGIAFDPAGDVVYYQALTGRTLYAVPGEALRDAALDADGLAAEVRTVGATGSSDGLLWDPASQRVLITALEHDAILATTPEGEVSTLVRGPAIAWPDSMAWGPDGSLWFTVARIHEGPAPTGPYAVYRLPPGE